MIENLEKRKLETLRTQNFRTAFVKKYIWIFLIVLVLVPTMSFAVSWNDIETALLADQDYNSNGVSTSLNGNVLTISGGEIENVKIDSNFIGKFETKTVVFDSVTLHGVDMYGAALKYKDNGDIDYSRSSTISFDFKNTSITDELYISTKRVIMYCTFDNKCNINTQRFVIMPESSTGMLQCISEASINAESVFIQQAQSTDGCQVTFINKGTIACERFVAAGANCPNNGYVNITNNGIITATKKLELSYYESGGVSFLNNGRIVSGNTISFISDCSTSTPYKTKLVLINKGEIEISSDLLFDMKLGGHQECQVEINNSEGKINGGKPPKNSINIAVLVYPGVYIEGVGRIGYSGMEYPQLKECELVTLSRFSFPGFEPDDNVGKTYEWVGGGYDDQSWGDPIDTVMLKSDGKLYIATEEIKTEEIKTEESPLTEVPDTLSGLFSSVDQIKDHLSNKLIHNLFHPNKKQIVYMNLKLMISTDGGRTWVEATKENFPSDGIRVRLPFPQGTNGKQYRFVVAHMYTVSYPERGWHRGQIDLPPVTWDDDGLWVTFRSMSPVAIAWEKIDDTTDDLPKTGDDSHFLLWSALAVVCIAAVTIVMKKRVI